MNESQEVVAAKEWPLSLEEMKPGRGLQELCILLERMRDAHLLCQTFIDVAIQGGDRSLEEMQDGIQLFHTIGDVVKNAESIKETLYGGHGGDGWYNVREAYRKSNKLYATLRAYGNEPHDFVVPEEFEEQYEKDVSN